MQLSGEASFPIEVDSVQLKTSVRTMAFFDRLLDAATGIVGPTGNIGGCFDELHDGVSTGDLLRDLMLNQDSPNAQLFSEEDQLEFVYRLFRIFAVGGTLCQPDHSIQR